jgi:hypothetical protein
MRWLLATLLLLPATAHATVVWDMIDSVSSEVPTGGVIVIAGQCSLANGCKWLRGPRVERADGTPVPGRIEAMGEFREGNPWIAFLPDPALPPGTVVRVFDEGLGASKPSWFEVRVRDASAFDLTSVSAELTITREVHVRSECCEEGSRLADGSTCVDWAGTRTWACRESSACPR